MVYLWDASSGSISELVTIGEYDGLSLALAGLLMAGTLFLASILQLSSSGFPALTDWIILRRALGRTSLREQKRVIYRGANQVARGG
jgi:hypothetical protein